MRYSIEPRDRIYVKDYGFLSFTKNMGTHLSNKNSEKLIDSAKKSTKEEPTGDLIGNKIADKISASKSSKKITFTE